MAEVKYSKKHEWVLVEGVKAASDVYTPVSGEVLEGNAAIVADPSLINKDPEGQGWFFKVKLTSPSELNSLMNKADYDQFVKNPS
jgi:glycine cleavage system H protein